MVMKRKPKLWNVCRSVEDRIHTWDGRFPGRVVTLGLNGVCHSVNVKVGDLDMDELMMRFCEAIPTGEMAGT